MYRIIKKYYEEHRFYHNFSHITKMFDIVYDYRNNLYLTDEQSAAILYHDAYYIPGNPDNEKKSADLFMDWCFDQKAVAIDAFQVRHIILDTKDEIPTIDESKLVIDLDLYSLGISAYKENRILIEKEYLLYFTHQQFIEGRIKWIESFLGRDKIYVSDIDIFTNLEQQARYNLQKDLEELKNET